MPATATSGTTKATTGTQTTPGTPPKAGRSATSELQGTAMTKAIAVK